MNRTPEGKFQAVRVLKPGKPEEGEFEVMFEGSRDECAAYLRNVVRQDRERQGQGSDDDHATTTPL